MGQDGAYDEEDGFLTEKATKKAAQYNKAKAKSLMAYSNLRSLSIGMLSCAAVFLCILTIRLELSDRLKWPIFFDFIPLFVMSCLVYIAATDFAATRISTDAALGKTVVVVCGFLGACGLLTLMISICLKLSHIIEWRWTSVLFPFWMGLLFSQFFFCFLIPGFLRNNMLKLFFGAFVMVWMTALAVLLAGLKLDGDLPGIRWWVLLTPIWGVLLAQVIMLEKGLMGVVCTLILLLAGILLPLQLDGTIHWPWAIVLVPSVIVIALNIFQMLTTGTDPEL